MKKLENLLNITLFERSKNKITLNETGKLTAELALSLVRQEYELIERITAFHQSNSTISFASNAPVPIYDIVPILNSHFSNMSVSSHLLEKKEDVITGLLQDKYQLIALHVIPDIENLHIQMYRKEQLYFSVPYSHPLAKKDKVSFQDIDGQNILLFSKIGFWLETCKKYLPNAHFLMMDEEEA